VDPRRKRKLRLVVALAVALALAGALVYTSFSDSTQASKPSDVVRTAKPGHSYQLTGKVVNGSIAHHGDELSFRMRDRDGNSSVPVRYAGVVPDPFRDGREVIVSGRMKGGTFVGERDSLVTKCPSKFTKEKRSS
jgi:cytochrome c-type biogenesis protein CcmE